jgi:hypothetical protein
VVLSDLRVEGLACFTTIVFVRAGWQHVIMEIRDAVIEDARVACQMLRRSITELCAADHRNDPAILSRWLGNKTPENFVSWIARPDNSLLVAVEDGEILAVGPVTGTGKITLNYVSPDARFRGSAGRCSVPSKRGLLSEAISDARSPAPRRPVASTGLTDALRTVRRSANLALLPVIRCSSF